MPLAPQTAATMEVLHAFHILNLQARVPPTEFYRSLERMTDGHGLMELPVSWLHLT
jgi:CxC2 like cysteine cluster associated with KDZ transposases